MQKLQPEDPGGSVIRVLKFMRCGFHIDAEVEP